MLKKNIVKTANQAVGRYGNKPRAIVVHVTEGTLESALSWIKDVKSRVSYHYIIGKDGSIYQIVDPENMAWSCGLVVKSTWPLLSNGSNPNEYTINIAYAGTAEEGPNRLQIYNLMELIAELCTQYKIPLDYLHIIGHNTIRTDKNCPGAKMDLPTVLYGSALSS